MDSLRPKVDKERLAQAFDVFAESEQYDPEGVKIAEDQRNRWIQMGAGFLFTREGIYHVVESFAMGFMRAEIDDFIDSMAEVKPGSDPMFFTLSQNGFFANSYFYFFLILKHIFLAFPKALLRRNGAIYFF